MTNSPKCINCGKEVHEIEVHDGCSKQYKCEYCRIIIEVHKDD